MKAIFIRLSRCDVDIAPYDKCGKIMLYRNVVREQSVGVDAYIDPRSAETIVGSLLGELSAKLTEGFCKEAYFNPSVTPTSCHLPCRGGKKNICVEATVSLRLGHAAALNVHRTFIHYRRTASPTKQSGAAEKDVNFINLSQSKQKFTKASP